MSLILVDGLKDRPGTGGPKFPNGLHLPAGIGITGDGHINMAGVCTFSGNVTIGGTLTYEDVTNIDSVGVVTARSGVNVSGGEFKVGTAITVGSAGVSTFFGAVNLNKKTTVNATLEATEGLNVTAGVGTFGGNVSIADKIIHTGDTNTALRFPTADVISFETGGSERGRFVNNGLKVGTTVDNDFAVGHFHDSATAARIHLTSGNTGTATTQGAVIMIDSGKNMEILNRENTNLEFFTNNSQVGSFDSSGRFLIGTTTEGHSNADDLTINNSGNTGITLRSGTGSNGNIFFSDASSGAAEYEGMLWYAHGTNSMRFATAQTERLVIDSNGAMELTPSENTGNDGFTVTPSGGDTASYFKVLGNQSTGAADGRNGGVINIDANYYVSTSTIFSIAARGTNHFEILGNGNHKIGGTGGTAAVSQSRNVNIGSNSEANLAIETHNDATSETSNIRFYKSGNTGASPQIVETDDNIAQLIAYGYDGTDYANAAAAIKMSVDGAAGSNQIPGKLMFHTNSGTTLTERMVITTQGVTERQSRQSATRTYEFSYSDVDSSGSGQNKNLFTINDDGNSTAALVAVVDTVGLYGAGDTYIHTSQWITGIRRASSDTAWSATTPQEVGANGSGDADLDISWSGNTLQANASAWMQWTVFVRVTAYNTTITVNC